MGYIQDRLDSRSPYMKAVYKTNTKVYLRKGMTPEKDLLADLLERLGKEILLFLHCTKLKSPFDKEMKLDAEELMTLKGYIDTLTKFCERQDE